MGRMCLVDPIWYLCPLESLNYCLHIMSEDIWPFGNIWWARKKPGFALFKKQPKPILSARQLSAACFSEWTKSVILFQCFSNDLWGRTSLDYIQSITDDTFIKCDNNEFFEKCNLKNKNYKPTFLAIMNIYNSTLTSVAWVFQCWLPNSMLLPYLKETGHDAATVCGPQSEHCQSIRRIINAAPAKTMLWSPWSGTFKIHSSADIPQVYNDVT